MASNIFSTDRQSLRQSASVTSLVRFLGIRPEELHKTLILFLYLLSIMAAYGISKNVRDTLFVKKIGPDQLPYVYLLIAILVGGMTPAYQRWSARLEHLKLMGNTMALTLASLVLFWWLFGQEWRWLNFALYLWTNLFGMISGSQFWLLAGFVFNAREGKRTFGLIVVGGILGNILGGVCTHFTAPLIGPRNLLLVSAFFVVLSMLLLLRIATHCLPSQEVRHAKQVTKARGVGGSVFSTFGNLRQSRFLWLLALLATLSIVVEVFIDYEFKFLLNRSIDTPEHFSSFLGRLDILLGIFSLLFQLFLTRQVIRRLGVQVALQIFPAGLLIGSMLLLFSPSLLAVSFLRLSEGGLRHSIFRSAVELLFLPLPHHIKARMKSFIDMTVDRVGRGIGGIFLLGLLFIRPSVEQISLIVMVLIFVWMGVTWALRTEYIDTFRAALEKKIFQPDLLETAIADKNGQAAILRGLTVPEEDQVLYCMRLMEDIPLSVRAENIRPLIRHNSPRVRALAIVDMAQYPEPSLEKEIEKMVEDPNREVRTASVGYLCSLHPKAHVPRFLSSSDYVVLEATLSWMTQSDWEPGKKFIRRELILQAMEAGGPHRESARRMAAMALRWIEDADFQRSCLDELMHDESPGVSRCAIRTAARVYTKDAWKLILIKLGSTPLRGEARQTLLQWGDEILPSLQEVLNDPAWPMSVRAHIPGMMRRFRSERATALILESLPHRDPFLHFRLVKALSKMRRDHPQRPFNESVVEHLVLREVEAYRYLGQWAFAGWEDSIAKEPAWQFLLKSLQERHQRHLELICRLLGLLYPQRDLYYIYHGMMGPQSQGKANALEFLDNLLRPELRLKVIPVMEEFSSTGEDRKNRQGTKVQAENILQAILIEGDDWLKALALHAAGQCRFIRLLPLMEQHTRSTSSLLRECARASREKMGIYQG